MKLSILYEDEHLLAVNKTAGIPSQPQKTAENNSMAEAVFEYSPKIAQIGNDPREGGLIHRLDVGTSGVLVFAKSNATFVELRELWASKNASRSLSKIYRAITTAISPLPSPSQLPLTISIPLGHSAKSSKRMLVLTRAELHRQIRGNPQEATTQVLKVVALEDHKADLSVRILTGVRHQIRAHLSSQGWPILGDLTYKGAEASRLFLHAWRVEIPPPFGQDSGPLIIEAPLPENWPLAKNRL